MFQPIVAIIKYMDPLQPLFPQSALPLYTGHYLLTNVRLLSVLK
jgi:hypothetical protein